MSGVTRHSNPSIRHIHPASAPILYQMAPIFFPSTVTV
jgi:hypothetical protein